MRLKKYLIFLIAGVLITFNCKAQQVYDNNDGIIAIGRSIQYFVDSTGSSTLEAAISNTGYHDFDSQVPNIGLVEYPVWLKVGITNNSQMKLSSIIRWPLVMALTGAGKSTPSLQGR